MSGNAVDATKRVVVSCELFQRSTREHKWCNATLMASTGAATCILTSHGFNSSPIRRHFRWRSRLASIGLAPRRNRVARQDLDESPTSPAIGGKCELRMMADAQAASGRNPIGVQIPASAPTFAHDPGEGCRAVAAKQRRWTDIRKASAGWPFFVSDS